MSNPEDQNVLGTTPSIGSAGQSLIVQQQIKSLKCLTGPRMLKVGSIAIAPLKPDGSNYRDWKSTMFIYLNCTGVADYLEKETAKLNFEHNAFAMTESCFVWSKLVESLPQNIVSIVKDIPGNQAYEIWNMLRVDYDKIDVFGTIQLYCSFSSFQIKDTESIGEQFITYRGMFNDLNRAGQEYSTVTAARTFVCKLPNSFNELKEKIFDTLSDTPFTVTMSSLGNRINSEEKKLRDMGKLPNLKSETGQALHAPKVGRKSYEDWKKSAICRFCDEEGHVQNECPKRIGKDKEEKRVRFEKKKGQANLASGVALSCPKYAFVTSRSLVGQVVLDSGSSFHIIPDKSLIRDYVENSSYSIEMPDGRTLNSSGKGDVLLSFELRGEERSLLLKDVVHFEEVQVNLIASARLMKQGYKFENDKDCVWLVDPERPKHRLAEFTLDEDIPILSCEKLKFRVARDKPCFVARGPQDVSIELLHKRLGHMSTPTLTKMINAGIVDGISISGKNTTDKVCETCAMSKLTKLPFPARTERAKQPLDLVHSDVVGPFPVLTPGKSKYLVTFIDDYSSYCVTFLMKSKDEVFQRFKEYEARVTNELGRSIKILRSDNGGEYCSREFDEFCQEKGIKHETSVPRNPEQNGVAERKNRTLIEMTRCLLNGGELPKTFWGEAILTATYLQNRLATTRLNGKTPYEAWTGKVPDLRHVRVYGCTAYALVQDGRSKLEDTSVKCQLVGYSETSKGYRLRKWNTNEVIVAVHVRFDEASVSKSSLQQDQDDIQDIVWYKAETVPIVDETAQEELEVEARVSDLFEEDERDSSMVEVLKSSGDDLVSNAEYLSASEEFEENAESVGVPDVTEQVGVVEARDECYKTRYGRTVNQPNRFSCYLATEYSVQASNHAGVSFLACRMNADGSPKDWKSLLDHPEKEKWVAAADDEWKSLMENEVFELVERPSGRNVIGSMWVFKRKVEAAGERYKARLVALGNFQVEGIDYDEVFAPVAKYASLRTILSIAATKDWEIYQLDVKTAFLYGDLDEDIYMKQPQGYVVKGKERLVCKLKKGLYGLKQSPRVWNQKIDAFFKSLGYVRSEADWCVYVMIDDQGHIAIIVLYVDDMVMTGDATDALMKTKKALQGRFDMKDLGDATLVLSMLLTRDRERRVIYLTQPRYLQEIVDELGEKDVYPLSVPMSPTTTDLRRSDKVEGVKHPFQKLVGKLLFAMITTRPDLGVSVGILSRFFNNPSEEHWNAAVKVLRYIKKTMDYGLRLGGTGEIKLIGYADSDYATDQDDRKSTTGYTFSIGEGTISWRSQKQGSTATSTSEAEYMAAHDAAREALWIRSLLKDLGFVQKVRTTIFEDNQACLDLAKNPKNHTRVKHIDVKFHFVREKVKEGSVDLVKVKSLDNVADTFTKPLARQLFEKHRDALGVVKSPGERDLSGSVVKNNKASPVLICIPGSGISDICQRAKFALFKKRIAPVFA